MSFTRDEFTDLVYDALNHLYDFSYLQRHPLVQCMSDPVTSSQKVQKLRRILLDAIRDMCPQPGAPAEAADSRYYRILELRYIEGLELRDAMEQIALAKSQYYREQGRAVEIVAANLWDRWQIWDGDAKPPDSSLELDLETVSRQHLARSEAERLSTQIEWERVDMCDLLAELRAFIEPLARTYNTRFELRIENRAWIRDANRILMRQAILNVLTYALDLAQRGEVTLSSVRTDAVEGIVVTAHRSQFQDADDSSRSGPARVGVGLEICRQLLETMGGKLEIGDTPHDPWEACLVWPVSRQPALLVIDDNVNFVHLFRRYLAGHSWNVVGATSSAEARQILTELRPAVILLDVMMPKEDGWELLRWLKSEVETEQIPVIICSVLNEPALAASLGAAGYLPKPVSQQSLLQVLTLWSPTPANLGSER